jgi:hypothetical protein
MFSQGFNVSFRMAEGFINYFVMMETLLEHLNFKNSNLFVENLPLQILNNNGDVISSVQFKGVIISSLSELNLNYTQNAPTVTNFTVGFSYNYLSVDLEMAR